NQTNIQPAYDVYASVQGRDLGGVSEEISKIVAELKKELKPGNSIEVRGQIQSMHDSFRNLAFGLLFAAVLVYLLMLVNYQNFGDPFVVILATSGDAMRNRHDAVHHGDELECALPDGSHHGSWGCLGEFHSARHLRAGTAARR